jgi:hypothetical protein
MSDAAAGPVAAPAASRAQRPRAGLVLQVAAIVGIVLCVLVLAGAWLGRSVVVTKVDDLSASAHGALDRAAATSSTVATRLQAVTTNLDAVTTAAQQVSANPTSSVGSQFPQLAARLSAVVDQYGSFRSTYDSLRQGVTDALAFVDSASRFVPGISVPQDLRDRLATVDGKLQSIDTAVSGLSSAISGTSAEAPGQIATAVAAKAAAAKAAVANASSAVGTSSQVITELGTRVDTLRDRIVLISLIGGVGVTIALIYVILLNVALWSLGRRWRQVPAGSPEA